MDRFTLAHAHTIHYGGYETFHSDSWWMASDHETPASLYVTYKLLGRISKLKAIKCFILLYYQCIISCCTVCHSLPHTPWKSDPGSKVARINSFFLLLIFCKNVHPPGKGTAKCSYPATPGMDLQKLSLPVYYTLRDPCWYSCSEVFW